MKVNSNKTNVQIPEDATKDAKARKRVQAEEANFTERINKAYRSQSVASKDVNVKSKEVYYDEDGNKLYKKVINKDGSVCYYMDDADGSGRTKFTDFDGDGNMDRLSHRTKQNPNKWDFQAIDKNDDGKFDTINYKF